MKYLYFIRHGESTSNVSFEWQGAECELTDKGMRQAELVASRMQDKNIDLLLSSTMKRAQQTAAIISMSINLPVLESPYLGERLPPSSFIGLKRDNQETLITEADILSHFGEDWKYEDEETFEDVKKRALSALAYVAARPEQHIIAVTHGYFMRILLATVILGPNVTPEEYLHFMASSHHENTGITKIGYDSKRNNPWVLLQWNDHAHLE